MIEHEKALTPAPDASSTRESSEHERIRTVVHLSRVIMRNYDIDVLPSDEWAIAISDEANQLVGEYMTGKRETLDDAPSDLFKVKKFLYDKEEVLQLEMDDILSSLRHEAGHFKYSDFKSLFEGQKKAKDEHHLPTSFWLMLEGIEDPRVNNLEGKESPAIDAQIKLGWEKLLNERLIEMPITSRPKLVQFMHNSNHYWLYGEQIPELNGTDVFQVTEQVLPLLDKYYKNTDLEERKLLQGQIWDTVKILEELDIEDEEKRQIIQEQNGNGQPSEGNQGQDSQPGEQAGKSNELMLPPMSGGKGQQSERPGQNQQRQNGDNQEGDLGQQESSNGNNSQAAKNAGQEDESDGDDQNAGEKIDLDQLTSEQLQEIEDFIDSLSEEERNELRDRARKQIDREQAEELRKILSKIFNLEKDEKTGEYEARPSLADEGKQNKASDELGEALKEIEGEERRDREEKTKKSEKELEKQKREAASKREKIDMKKAGFRENEREKFRLYQKLEYAMLPYVRNFIEAMEKVVPRKKEDVYEGGFFSGPKFDRRDLIRRAPLGDEQFHMRQVEQPVGDPRLFIGLLIDNSGSMQGVKQEEARKTAIFFAKVCEDMRIPFMAASFGAGARLIKTFRQNFSNPSERIKPAIIDNTMANESYTNLHAGIEVTIEEMNKMRRKVPNSHGLIFVISDGGANLGLVGKDLTEYVEENRGRLTFKPIGLAGLGERGNVRAYLISYFGEANCAFPKTFKDLPDEAFRSLRTNLIRFKKFLR